MILLFLSTNAASNRIPAQIFFLNTIPTIPSTHMKYTLVTVVGRWNIPLPVWRVRFDIRTAKAVSY